MKTRISTSSVVLIVMFLILTGVNSLATNISEPPDFPNSAPGTPATLTQGLNTFSGSVTSNVDGRDYFYVTVPTGTRITQVSKTVTGGGFSGYVSFNNETISGTGTANFTGAGATPYPLPAGTYDAYVNADFSTGSPWSVTVTVAPSPDYVVTTGSGQITVTDVSANNDTLVITNAAAGFIKFAATNRIFSINGSTFLTNDTGNLSLIGMTNVTYTAGSGNDTINLVTGVAPAAYPGVTINGGSGTDIVNVNGTFSISQDDNLIIDLQADPDSVTNSINITAGSQVFVTGVGAITMQCNQGISLAGSAGLNVQNGDITLDANQQDPPDSGSFIGVNLDGATLKSTGTGFIYVDGTGGDDSGGSQLGVQVIDGGKIIGGNSSSAVFVNGYGGNSTGIVNRGVTVYGTGSTITSGGGPVIITGNAGTNGSYYGIGVSVLYGGQISAGGTGNVTVTGTGAGQAGSGYNQGLELAQPGSLITSSGGNIIINGYAGPGGSSGIYLSNTGAITAPVAGGSIELVSDSDTFDSTVSIITTNHASSVTFETGTFGTLVNLGGANATGNPATLGLTDAELDCVNTAILYIGLNSGGVTISAPITQPYATNFVILPGLFGSLKAAVSGTDISLVGNGTVTVQFGTVAFPITGSSPDTGYPQLGVVGRVNLNGCALSLATSTYAGNVGDTFTLINNDGSDPVTGTFTGLPENAVVSIAGQPARIHYAGGDGNDVTLQRIANGTALSGSRTNGNWQLTGLGSAVSNAFTILATTNFITWTNLGKATSDYSGKIIFTDTNAFRFPYRFYRTTN